MVLNGLRGFTVGVIVPVGYGHAAWVFSSPFGTPAFVTTMGVDLSDVGGNFVGAADHLFDAYVENFIETTSSQLNLDRVLLTIGVDGGGNGSVESTREQVQGEDNGSHLPLNVGLILRKQTLLLGREGRGRMFLPGALNSNQVNEGGTVDPGAITGFSNAGNSFLEDIRAIDAPGAPEPTLTPMEPVLLHSSDRVPTPITSMGVSSLLGVQRKRVR